MSLPTDPATLQSFWLAVISLISACGIALQQWNASRGKARGEAAQQTANETKAAVVDHNKTSIAKLTNIQEVTNGTLTAAQNENADLKSQIAVLQEKLKATQGAATP